MRRQETLEEYARRSGRLDYGRLRELYSKVLEGDLELVDPNPPRTLLDMLRRLEYTLWYYSTLTLIALVVIVIPLTDYIEQLKPLRYILGTIYVLFIPGYVTIEALYPEERSLKPLERLALSIGLSLAIVPLLGLILNYTPFGIRLWPVTLTLAIYTLVVATIALYRKHELVKLEFKARG